MAADMEFRGVIADVRTCMSPPAADEGDVEETLAHLDECDRTVEDAIRRARARTFRRLHWYGAE